MMDSYFRFRLSQVPSHLEEDVTSLCFKWGASGVSEALLYKQPDLTYDPKIIHQKFQQFDAYFSEAPDSELIRQISEISPLIRSELHEEESKDWLAEWKKGFIPFQLTGPFWIVPSWLKAPEGCTHPIFIDPGMAFGTGTHATTQMMAYFIYKLSKKNKTQISNWSLLDVGTGTAILAILAQQSGFGLVTGVEIDPEARRVAKENVVLNGSSSAIEISDKQIDELHSSFDVVVANIIDGVLLKIKKELIAALKPGGHLMLTGILLERDTHFFNHFIENTHLMVVSRIEKDEWVGYWLALKS